MLGETGRGGGFIAWGLQADKAMRQPETTASNAKALSPARIRQAFIFLSSPPWFETGKKSLTLTGPVMPPLVTYHKMSSLKQYFSPCRAKARTFLGYSRRKNQCAALTQIKDADSPYPYWARMMAVSLMSGLGSPGSGLQD
jgi:hypothetical protein